MTFLESCIDAIGPEYVTADDYTRDHWARTTLYSGTRPIAIARPGSTKEVQSLVHVANRHGVCLYPVSRGRNWGYGDACAPHDGCLLLDLSRMNAIHAVDQKLGFAIIEPGVSQGQLAEHLKSLGGAWVADCTGAGPEASVIGNLADRGFGHSPYGDRFANSCAFEVVLADGSVCNTGFAGLPNQRAADVYKWGIGPAIDGLFTQSNLGIITRATVWLMPRPQRQVMLLLLSDKPHGVFPMVDAIRELRLSGVLTSTVHIFNRMRLLGAFASFPYDQVDGSTSLERHPELLATMVRAHKVPWWGATASLTGSPKVIRAAVAIVRLRLRAHRFPGRILVIRPSVVSLFRFAGRLIPSWAGGRHVRGEQQKLEILWNLLAGTPDIRSVSGGGWRARRVATNSTDPRDGSAGMVWISPVLPATSESVGEVELLAQRILNAHGFEYQVTYSFVNPRALCGVMSICFDREDTSQRQRAHKCHDELVDSLVERGYIPYRGSPQTVRRLWRHKVAAWDVLGKLRAALDPNGIMAPGRYIPDFETRE